MTDVGVLGHRAHIGDLRDQPPERDPLGRSALFSPPPRPTVSLPRSARPAGKRALYSVPEAPRVLQLELPFPSLEVECSACGASSELDLVEFAWLHLPFWLWVPWLRYSRFIHCPACERRNWLRVSWAGVGGLA